MDTTGRTFKDYSYYLSADLNLFLHVKIASLEGILPQNPISDLLQDPYLRHAEPRDGRRPDLFVTCQVHADNKPLTLPSKTAFKSFSSQWTWNEWIVLPIAYCDLPVTSVLTFTIWNVYKPRQPSVVGGATFSLFGRNNSTMKKGRHKLFIWPTKVADGNQNTTTPSKVSNTTEMDRLEKLMRKYDRRDLVHSDWLDHLAFREIERINQEETMVTKHLFLYIDLPQFDFPLVFCEKEYLLPPPMALRSADSTYVIISDLESIRMEATQDDPVENKHRKLTRSHRNGPLDRDLKPNAKIRDELNKMLRYSPTQTLNKQEKDLLWKFRFYLTRDKKALTKFLKCVVWSDAVEVKQAVDLLSLWVEIDVEDALELLGPTFENRSVRSYAVSQLKKADDEELQLYLLQLVQALKFEGIGNKTQLHESPLAEFLIDRGIKNQVLGISFYWYLMVECEDRVVGRMYGKVVYQFMSAMMEVPDGHHRRDVLKRQADLVATLAKISRDLRANKDPRPKKIEKLRAIIADSKNNLLSFPPLPLPLEPNIQVTGIIPEEANVFKSALFPLRLTFSCLDGGRYPVIFKTGDDLRQDQLIVQMITLMDKLLRKLNLDVKLTPYKVLATGTDYGFVQFIPSLPLASILADYNNSLLMYLREHNPDEASTGSFGINAAVMDAYVKSCAGYSVITYLLGIGDRHLDNLLLTPGGNLFHIDFGFILGRDPKPFPPPMKLCKEMVEAMGGTNGQHYQKFKSYCFIAFESLRKSANLILNLFALMTDANLPDIAIEPDKAVLKVQEKFRLDLSEEEAMQYFQALINESVGALFPQVMEKIHQWAQYWRSSIVARGSAKEDRHNMSEEELADFGLVHYAFSNWLVLSIKSPLEVGTILQLVQYNPRFAQHVHRDNNDSIKMESLDEDDDQPGDDDSSSVDAETEVSLDSPQVFTVEKLGAVDSLGYLTRSSFNNDDPTRPPYELAASDSNSVFGLLHELIGLEGLQALWKGVWTEWMKDCLNAMIQPSVEGALNDYFEVADEGIPLLYADNPWPTLATTVGSQVITEWLLSPFELARTRLIVQTTNPYHRKYKSFCNCISLVAQEEGLSAFYAGPSLLPAILYNTIDPLVTTAHHFLIARVFGIAMNEAPFTYAMYDLGLTTLGIAITLPLETVRRRLWAQQRRIKRNVNGRDFVTCVRRSEVPYTSMWNCLYRICTEEGNAEVVSKGEKRKKSRSQYTSHSSDDDGISLRKSREVHIGALYRGFWLRFSIAAATVMLASLS
ncbi:hypothetical protein SeLEV6574_g05723 [Synchytrium endobioticum]|uniref:phosphatidylinositol 3-kinase n=1 Tax=Synchytrium endobioticum TaxID=286115 RepID=A0A507CSN1_9FUNG|nr:hypothetical protein SeLEV6574_g05723 [Synchytrium endobioticum]